MVGQLLKQVAVLDHSESSLLMSQDKREPHHFFEALFDEHMWQCIADETNLYAKQKKELNGTDLFEASTSDVYPKSSRIVKSWKEVTSGDIKIFMSHILVMGVVKISYLEKYWSRNEFRSVPIFGRYMTRNCFQSIFSNIHFADNTETLAVGSKDHDPLYKVCCLIDMMERNFKHVYKPQKEISVDESCCEFKGRIRFKVYNPKKPNKFHMKLFSVCEAVSGYTLGFEVYTGKNSRSASSKCFSFGSRLYQDNQTCGFATQVEFT